jgi:hypothetical protein
MTVDTTKTRFTLRHNILKRFYDQPVTISLSGAGTYTLYTHGLGWIPNVFVEYLNSDGKKQLISNMAFHDFGTSDDIGDVRGEIKVNSSTVSFVQKSTVSRSCIFYVKVYIDE